MQPFLDLKDDLWVEEEGQCTFVCDGVSLPRGRSCHVKLPRMNSGAELPLAAAEATLPSNTSPRSEIGEASESSMRVSLSHKFTVRLGGLLEIRLSEWSSLQRVTLGSTRNFVQPLDVRDFRGIGGLGRRFPRVGRHERWSPSLTPPDGISLSAALSGLAVAHKRIESIHQPPRSTREWPRSPRADPERFPWVARSRDGPSHLPRGSCGKSRGTQCRQQQHSRTPLRTSRQDRASVKPRGRLVLNLFGMVPIEQIITIFWWFPLLLFEWLSRSGRSTFVSVRPGHVRLRGVQFFICSQS